MARMGIDVVLISRSIDKLQKVAKEIEEAFGVNTKVIAIDFTQGVEIYEQIRKEIEGLEIGTLINNVGMAYPYPEYFLDMPNGDKLCQDMIFCNIMSVTMMMRVVMPQMVERKRGVVVNIASIAAVAPTPLMCLYGASKVLSEFCMNACMLWRKYYVLCLLNYCIYLLNSHLWINLPVTWLPSMLTKESSSKVCYQGTLQPT